MSEAPEKIWVDDQRRAWEQHSKYDIPYIRADLVDELVEALEECLKFNGYFFDEEPIEALIAKVRGEK